MAASRPTTSLRTIPAITTNSCSHLPGSRMFVVCVSCEEESVCHTCVGCKHIGHTVIDREDFLDFRKDVLSKLVRTADIQLSEMIKRLNRVRNIQERSTSMVESVIKDIETRGDILKQEIDKITEEFTRKCRVSEWNNNNKLSKIEDKIHKEVQDLDQSITKCKNVVSSTRYDNFLLFESDLRHKMDCTIDSLPVLQILGLDTSRQDAPPSQLKGVYGALKIDDWKFESATDVVKSSDSKWTSTEVDEDSRKWPIKKIVQGIFQHSSVSKVHCVCPVDNLGAWIVCAGTNQADFTSSSGDVRKSVKAKMVPKTKTRVVINDIINTVDTGKTLMCCSDKSIRQLLPNDICGIMFRADDYVSSLCESQNASCILVCNDSGKLVEYRENGTILQTIERDNDGRKLMTSPYKARVNTNNGDIVLIEHAMPRHVIIIDKMLTVISKYYGDLSNMPSDRSTNIASYQSMQDEFDPRDVSFYEESNIAIADYGSRSVILIDRNGTLLRTLWRDDNRPTCLGISRTLDDIVTITWIGFGDGSVKVIRHLPIDYDEELSPLTIDPGFSR